MKRVIREFSTADLFGALLGTVFAGGVLVLVVTLAFVVALGVWSPALAMAPPPEPAAEAIPADIGPGECYGRICRYDPNPGVRCYLFHSEGSLNGADLGTAMTCLVMPASPAPGFKL